MKDDADADVVLDREIEVIRSLVSDAFEDSGILEPGSVRELTDLRSMPVAMITIAMLYIEHIFDQFDASVDVREARREWLRLMISGFVGELDHRFDECSPEMVMGVIADVFLGAEIVISDSGSEDGGGMDKVARLMFGDVAGSG